MAPPKPRIGARGAMKVKSGCQTCKIRHKKCDEARPACSQCSGTGRRCDFTPINSIHRIKILDRALEWRPQMSLNLLRPSLPYHMRNLTHIEASHFDYFRLVCARDFALCFDSTSWENLLLRNAHLQPSIYHAALGIAALSRQHYAPTQVWNDPGSTRLALEFTMEHYNWALQTLNECLEETVKSCELAVLASILFVHIEAFQQFQKFEKSPNLITVHLNGGFAIVHYLKSLSQHVDYVETALDHIRNQIEQFEQFSA